MQKQKTPFKLFIAAFAAIAIIILIQNVFRQSTIVLPVPDNKGTSVLETAGQSLICIFQDGKTCVWDWSNLNTSKKEFHTGSDRAVLFSSEKMAAVATLGGKKLTIYSLPAGQEQNQLAVGWEDQDIWPRLSFDKKAAAIIRKNPTDSSGHVRYEFLSLNPDKDILGQPVPLLIDDQTETLADFSVNSNRVLYVIGNKSKTGRIAAMDLEKGDLLWDRVYENTAEFCSLMLSPDDQFLFAGNRDGILYKIKAVDGQTDKKIILLEPGEKRPITNDYSVLNLAFSADGRYYVASITPQAYILRADDDKVFHRWSPADKLVSKIAFSPDSQWIATSDIRAGYPIKIWKMPESK